MLQKLDLFSSKKEAFFLFFSLFIIFCVNIDIKFYNFRYFVEENSFHEGIILNAYMKESKHKKPYQVAKISADFGTLYTIFWKIRVKSGDKIRFKVLSENISFKDFLSRQFFAPTYWVKSYENHSFKGKIQNFISSQHENKELSELYSALFLATPISKDLRSKIQRWGISHLVAISGFHLGVMYGAIFFILRYIYGFFQNRFFPYRDRNFDLGIIILTILGLYMYLIDFTPSFLRSYVMSVLGFIFYMRYFKVFSFINLALAVCLILAFFPSLLFSIGFWFSVMGVFYIFLYFHHFSFNKWQDLFFVNIWVFLGLNIPVHFWFAYTSFQQIGAVILSIVFVIFYPIAFLLHIIGFGNLMDGAIEVLLNVQLRGGNVFTPLWLFILYIPLSIFAIFNKYLAIFSVILGLFVFFLF